jgi:pimeloyl-ACP methyl ester carboxylesterase
MRKKFCYSLAVIATLTLTYVHAQQTAKMTSSGIGYLEYLPQGYSSNTNKYPVVISLHGIKEKGNTLADVARVANVGLPKYVKYGQQYSFILISPQLKTSMGSWTGDYVMQVVNYVKTKLRIDPSRIYLTGLSLGGYGVWKTIAAYPEVFAAISPVCSGGNALSSACKIAAEDVPVWTFHGDKDAVVSYTVSTKMVSAINACTPKPSPLAKITIYPGAGHVIWDKAYKETTVLNWMLGFRKGSTSTTPSPENELPVVSAGGDKSLTLPTNAVSIQGSASDPDGSIVSYTWSKTSGGTASMSGTTTSKLSASNLASGTYTFRLTAKDNKGASKYDDMKVTVGSSSTNKLPIVSAGSDHTITFPTQAITLVGSASDPDGTIASYKWTQISGTTAPMKNTTTRKLWAYDLKAGTYVFRLTVKDNSGATKYDDTKLVVKSTTASLRETPDETGNTVIRVAK